MFIYDGQINELLEKHGYTPILVGEFIDDGIIRFLNACHDELTEYKKQVRQELEEYIDYRLKNIN